MQAQSRQRLPTLALLVVLLTSFYPRAARAIGFSSLQIPAPIRYGGSSTNAEMATYQGSVYVAYADEDFTLTVARRDAQTGKWSKATQIDQTIGGSDSSHNQMALAIDGDGYIHVWYGMHDRQGMRYARSNNPDHVSAGFTVRSGEFPNANESYTYPNAASAPNGDIYFSIRNQGRRLPLFHWDNRLKQWQELAVFVEGTAAQNEGQTYVPYLPWLYVDSANNVHIKWDWAFGEARGERHNGSYALYRPDTGRFYRADGTEYALPITALTADVFQPMPDGVTWDDEGIALSDLAVDAANRPLISYAFSPAGSADKWEHRVAHWDGQQWVVIRLTDQTKKWNKDFLIADQGVLYYYARTNAGTAMWTSVDQGATWSTAILVYNRALDGAVITAPNSHVLLHLSGAESKTDSELSYLMFP